MKRFVTMMCSVAFMVAGVLIARSTANIRMATQSLNAAVIPEMRTCATSVNPANLPLDLQLNLVKHDTVFVTDTIYPTFLNQDVVIKGRKPKRKFITQRHKKSVKPDTIPTFVRQDTLYVPSVYVIVPLEKLDSTKSIVNSTLKK